MVAGYREIVEGIQLLVAEACNAFASPVVQIRTDSARSVAACRVLEVPGCFRVADDPGIGVRRPTLRRSWRVVGDYHAIGP